MIRALGAFVEDFLEAVQEAPDCRLRRTLDGRAVCTTALPAAAATANLGPLPEAPADIALAAGRYVVIGSFEELDNAVDWAGLNADFGAGIQRAPSFEPTMYRVLIGPLERTDGELMQAILDSVGVAESWQLSVCHGGVTPAAAPCQPLLADTKLAQGGLPLPF